ncbi:hypothetical protein B0T17DRAFT_493603 [Bombardia bombarda]|uniref:SET domain-containing protein n=1 Tax=Bombardia bombarda TaxID=252184 RepID=A0AA40C1G0_9PEZI|nr:hypothetical protein B0T17DRAFT_493603 [Bombardia bombarda]
MRPLHILSLAVGASALQRQISLSPTASCPWRLPPPQLACSIDELDDLSSAILPPRPPSPPPSKWEGPHDCVNQYCIFSNPGFADGRGIVTITTARAIEKLKAIEQTRNIVHPPNPPPYTIAPIPAKGLGLLANTTLHRGTPIMRHTPAVLIHRSFLEHLPPRRQHALLDAAITQHLPLTLREAFLAQMGHFGNPHKISDILITNSFQMDLGGDDNHHYGNFPEVSRFNHDCRPNVAFHIGADLTHTTTAVRAVQPGEELTISYLGMFEPRAMRQQRALQAWGFACTCSQCGLGEGPAAKSDGRLEEIARIEGAMADVASGGVTPALLRRVVRLYKEERLEASVAGVYTLVAMNWNMLGEEGMARKYAGLAAEAAGGEGEGDAVAMRELERDPRGHFTWRRRVGG